jgi:general secretion pathway protein G
MKPRKKKRALTLLEIMIVIVLIGLIGSVIGVNMKGSLEEGKAFKTRQAREQIVDILMLEVARGVPIDEVIRNPATYLEHSGLVKNAKNFVKDGWGEPFEILPSQKTAGNIIVKSARLTAYEKRKKDKLSKSASAVVTEAVEEDDDGT